MAKRKFVCDPCGKDFDHHSKYARHLESASHARFFESIRMSSSFDEASTTDTNVDFSSSCSHMNFDNECWNFSSDSNTDHDKQQPPHLCDDDDDTEDSALSEETSDIDYNLIDVLDQTEGENFHPFDSKLQALSYMLTISPRPIGEVNLKFIFHIFRELSPVAPTLSSLKKIDLPGLQAPTKYYTPGGIPFYVNSPKHIVQMCLGMPEIAAMIQRLPVRPINEISEMYHGKRWMTDDRFFLPMINTNIGYLFIGEFVHYFEESTSSGIAKVLQFFSKEGTDEIFAVVIPLKQDQETYSIQPQMELPVNSFISKVDAPQCITRLDSHDLLSHDEYEAFISVHKYKTSSNGRQCVMLPLILYTDDTSGNKSKVWNKFDSWCISLAGLPKKENSKLHNIHFVCSSNKAPVLDISLPLVQELVQLEESGIEAYDAFLNETVVVYAPVMCVIGDNPRQSELMSHLGAKANYFCRMCMARRGENVAPDTCTRSKPQTLAFINEITSKRTETEKKKMQTDCGIKSGDNPLLLLPVDLHKCTPVETLHSILLGPYKYLLRSLMERLTSDEKNRVLAILGSFNFSGFKMKLTYRLCRYFKSFVGRDFKALAQCCLFIFRSVLTPEEKKLWLALSKVFKITYCDPFYQCNEEEYREICENFVAAVSNFAPHLKRKIKIHLMLHLTDNMVDFGPTSAFNTERYEAFNSLIRLKNVFGNKLSPSRDIAIGFANLEHLRFVCSGGSIDGEDRTGQDLRSLYNTTSVQSFINGRSHKDLLSDKTIYQHGSLRKISAKTTLFKDVVIHLNELSIPQTIVEIKNSHEFTVLSSDIDLEAKVRTCGAVVSNTGDLIAVGDYVIYATDSENQNDIGLLVSCLQEPKPHSVASLYCIVRPMYYMDIDGQHICNEYDCPLLNLTNILYCVPSYCVLHAVSVVHECSTSCLFTETLSSRRIEHEDVNFCQLKYTHDWNCKLYSLNVYCMNNDKN